MSWSAPETKIDKERFDALMKLAEFRSNIREARRNHEWRISLGLWVGMAGGIVSLSKVPALPLAIFLTLVVAGHAWYWVRWNWLSNERDIRLAYFYMETAQQQLFEGSPIPDRNTPTERERRFGFLRHGPPVFQVVGTVLLAGAWLFRASAP